MNAITNHLLQSTVFAGLVALAALALRANHAAIRHRLWLAASLKFLLPFALLVAAGSRVTTRVPAVVPTAAVRQIASTFESTWEPIDVLAAPLTRTTPVRLPMTTLLAAAWMLGAAVVAGRWFRRWMILRRALQSATPLRLAAPARAFSSASRIEPGVFGVFRPVLLLPEGFAARVSKEELDSIIAHELCHIRRRDNLTSALHMIVETVFWFHPLVWWIGVKLVEERERACDEAVLRAGSAPDVYAQGIVNVCKFYLESPLVCASGVSGADLRKRIAEILMERNPMNLSGIRKIVLAATALAIVAIPLAIGVLHSQTLAVPSNYGYEVASVKPSAPEATSQNMRRGSQGGLQMENFTVLALLEFAYDLREYQVANAPQWVKTERYDLSFTPDTPEKVPQKQSEMEALFDRHRQRMRKILKDRFALELTEDTRELPMYALVIAKGGHKLQTPTVDRGHNMSSNRGVIQGTSINLRMFATSLSGILGRAVINETGLDGPFDLKLEWTPEGAASIPGASSHEAPAPAAESGPSIFSAIQEQLGLKLEAKKGPVPVVVIQKIERPTSN